MRFIGLNPVRDEIADVREFFASISQSEQVRLYNLFQDMLGKTEALAERDWSDKLKDGILKAPEQAKSAKSGK